MIPIDKERLYASLSALGDIGAYDAGSGVRGVNRLALTAADGEGRRHVVAKMRAADLEVTVDRIGNVYGRRAGRSSRLRPVMMGSHIDSVPTAGRFDGCLGVLGALEVVSALDDAKIMTERPVVVAFFTDEEGSRFGTDMLGSAVATGRVALEDAYALRDRSGATVKDELAKIGFLGDADVRLAPPHAYLECHIEQGPILRASHTDIGVVSGVQAISWHELTVTGRAAHAGTTPMAMRADAGVAAALVNLRLREMSASGRYGREMRATMGAITPSPGLVNVVPGSVVATVDLRNPDDALMRAAEAALLAFYDEVARAEGVQIAWRQTARTPCVAFDEGLQSHIARCAGARGLAHARVVSGAGHDAQEMARITRAAMIFVPGERDGVSHNPRELSTPEQCARGVSVLCDVVRLLADEKEEVAS